MQAQDSSPGLRPGDVLAGKYRVERVLGEGGMGVVVAARHLRLDDLVAIKLLRPDIAQDPQTVARFAREARAASKLKSEHVARVTDVDTTPEGSAYMVMEFLEGKNLHTILKTCGPLPVEQAVGYVLDVCHAMVEAHALGIIHRDLKPENLFLAERAGSGPLIKVLDFGISKLVGPMAESKSGGLTATQAVLGSPHYMSPDQLISSRTVDTRTDIWSLGVTLYQLLTDAVPFCGQTMPETCTLIMFGQPEPPSARRSGVPPKLDAIVMRCLEKERDRRFASMAELAAALAPFAPAEASAWVSRATAMASAPLSSSLSRGNPPLRPSHHGAVGTDPTIRATALTHSWRAQSSRTRTAVILIGTAVMLALGTSLWLAIHPRPAESAGGAAHASPEPASASPASGSIDGSRPPLAAAPSTATPQPSASATPPPAAAPAAEGPDAGAAAALPAARGTAPARPKPRVKKPQPAEEDTIGF